jgi:hypothetical protein
MRLIATLALLTVLATACNGDSQPESNTATPPTEPPSVNAAVRLSEGEAIVWHKLRDGGATRIRVHCQTFSRDALLCEGKWRNATDGDCNADFSLRVEEGRAFWPSGGTTIAMCVGPRL